MAEKTNNINPEHQERSGKTTSGNKTTGVCFNARQADRVEWEGWWWRWSEFSQQHDDDDGGVLGE